MDEKPPAGDDYADLARRLGFDRNRSGKEGPTRGRYAGPSDELPLEKLHRLSALMETMAVEIQSVRSATYRAQLWQQWTALCLRRPEPKNVQKRLGSSSGGSSA